MSLELFQGFDYLAFADLTAEGYVSSGGGQSIAAAFTRYAGGQGLQLDGTSSGSYLVVRTANLPAFTTSAVKVIGFALNIQSGLSAGVVYPLGLIGATTNCSLLVNADGSLSIQNASGTALATSAAGILASATWAYLEVKSTGSQVVCNVNGSAACSASLALGSISRADIGSREYGTSTSGYKLWVDDLYCCNGSGTAQNDFLGPCRVQTLVPSGAGNYSQWTPNGATNDWQCVKETTEDGDTTYASDGTAGHRDSYTHAPLAGTINGILAVDDVLYARADPSSSGTHTLASSQRIAGTDYDNPAKTLSSAYSYFHDISVVSPATAAAYTASEINAMELGVKNVSG